MTGALRRRLQRWRTIARWAGQALCYRPWRTALTASTIAIATALVLSTAAFHVGYSRAVDQSVAALGYQVLATGKGCPHEAATLILRGGAIPMYVDESTAAAVAADPDVADMTRFFMQSLPGDDGRSAQLYVGIDDRFLALKPSAELQRGSWFSSPAAGEAIVGYNVAEYRRLEIGDVLEVLGRSIAVVGVLDKLGTQDDGTVFLPLAFSQALFDRRDQLTGLGIRVEDTDRIEALMARLWEVPSLQVVRLSQVQSTILTVFRGLRRLLASFSAICLGVAILGVVNVALMTVHDRTSEMGVLRAIGCSTGDLFQLVWSESLALGVVGAAAGVGLAAGLRGLVDGAVRAQLPVAGAGSVVILTPAAIVASVAVVVALCTAAALVPAWQATRVTPLASMRGEGA